MKNSEFIVCSAGPSRTLRPGEKMALGELARFGSLGSALAYAGDIPEFFRGRKQPELFVVERGDLGSRLAAQLRTDGVTVFDPVVRRGWRIMETREFAHWLKGQRTDPPIVAAVKKTAKKMKNAYLEKEKSSELLQKLKPSRLALEGKLKQEKRRLAFQDPLGLRLLFVSADDPECEAAEKSLNEAGISYRRVSIADDRRLAAHYGVARTPAIIDRTARSFRKYDSRLDIHNFIGAMERM